MPTWEERNAETRLLEERGKLKVSPGTSVQRITSDACLRSTPLSDHKPSSTPPETANGDPLALVSSGSPARSPDESASKTTKKRSRQLLKIRLEHADNVMNIVENWRLEKRAAPNVIAAIQLLAAIEAGNLDYVRENYPLLVEALRGKKRKSDSLSYKESESLQEKESERERKPEIEQLAEAIDTITGRDRHLNRDVYDLADQLHKSNYTADDLRLWHEKCWPKDWRKKKNPDERPTLKLIRELIGQVRSLPPVAENPESSPYLADPFFRRNMDADLIPKEGPARPTGGVPLGIRRNWDAVVNEMSVRNRRFHDLWLRRIEPVHYEYGTGVLYVSVPDRFHKAILDEWREAQQCFNSILPLAHYLERMTVGQPGDRQVRVEFVAEGEPLPLLHRDIGKG